MQPGNHVLLWLWLSAVNKGIGRNQTRTPFWRCSYLSSKQDNDFRKASFLQRQRCLRKKFSLQLCSGGNPSVMAGLRRASRDVVVSDRSLSSRSSILSQGITKLSGGAGRQPAAQYYLSQARYSPVTGVAKTQFPSPLSQSKVPVGLPTISRRTSQATLQPTKLSTISYRPPPVHQSSRQLPVVNSSSSLSPADSYSGGWKAAQPAVSLGGKSMHRTNWMDKYVP